MALYANTPQTYLNKFSSTTKLIKAPNVDDGKVIIVIPSYLEKDLPVVLQSLQQCDTPENTVEVIVVLNSAASDTSAIDFHKLQLKKLESEFMNTAKLYFHFLHLHHFSKKHAGVGSARKEGMDEAVRRFSENGNDGLIVCLDADCRVSKNYLCELEKIAEVQNVSSVCIHFEHSYQNEPNEELRYGILLYENFLRYYKEALQWSGFPFYFHTIGSSMAVRCTTYCRAGGMNRRKAGEDFYFLHKVFPMGITIELNSCTVYPSCRTSERVPFGTGRAQLNFLKNRSSAERSYSFLSFTLLKEFMSMDPQKIILNELPLPLKNFLTVHGFEKKRNEIAANTASANHFRKRFFAWFDGFMVLKFVHFCRDNYFPDEILLGSINAFFIQKGKDKLSDHEKAIVFLRKMQSGV